MHTFLKGTSGGESVSEMKEEDLPLLLESTELAERERGGGGGEREGERTSVEEEEEERRGREEWWRG